MLDGLKVADIVAPLIVALIIWLINGQREGRKEIVGSVDKLSVKVGETNGRVIRLETSVADHIKADEMQFKHIADEQKDQWEKLNNRIERRKS